MSCYLAGLPNGSNKLSLEMECFYHVTDGLILFLLYLQGAALSLKDLA